MFPKLLPVAFLLLLTACGPRLDEHAKSVALKKLPRLLGKDFRPASLRVYNFSSAVAEGYFLGEQTGQDFELVTYDCLVHTSNPLASTSSRPVKFAALVDRNDSLTFFVPDQHQNEFVWNYGVYYRPQ